MPEVIALVPPASTGTPVALAAAANAVPAAATGSTITRSSAISPALVAALVLQVGLLIAAGVEFARRWRRRR